MDKIFSIDILLFSKAYLELYVYCVGEFYPFHEDKINIWNKDFLNNYW